MSWIDDKDYYQNLVKKIEPSCVLTTKDNWFWKILSYMWFLVTLGRQGGPKYFLENLATTIGPIMAYPKEWKFLDLGLLMHEVRHVKQFRWFGLGIHPWIGFLPMAIVYLMFPIPVGFAYIRYRLELDADRERWIWEFSQKRELKKIFYGMECFCELVCGPTYGWAWPHKWGKKGFTKVFSEVLNEHSKTIMG